MATAATSRYLDFTMTTVSSRKRPQDVGDFYARLVFPSRTSHPEYAELVPERHGERIGDFGCGQSLFYEALRGYQPSPVFFDLSMRALQTLDHGSPVRGDLYDLPFPTATFDRIFCIGVVHHFPEPEGALREIARVLRHGALLTIGVYAPGTAQAK